MNGEAQCRDPSLPGSVPPRCGDCIQLVYGVCQCDCISCWDSQPAEVVEFEPVGERDAEVLLDSGASYHLVPVGEEVAGTITTGAEIELQTVGGTRTYNQNAAMGVGPVGRQAGLVVDADSPAVLSMEQLVVAGYSFRWDATGPEPPR